MKFCILMGSPHANGNTAELLKPFISELVNNGCEVEYIFLEEKNIQTCKGCCACQNVEGKYGCVQNDDVEQIMDVIIESDYVIYATPIYMWNCTAKMKALLDRHFALNKGYGTAKGSLWEGKKIALIMTHGYEAAYATEPFETSMIRYLGNVGVDYLGMYSVRDQDLTPDDFLASFQTENAVNGAKNFALQLLGK